MVVPVLVAAASLAAVSQASAATVVVSPGGAVTATATRATRLVINGSATVNCTSSSATATLANGSAASYPVTISSNVTLRFTGCTITGGVPVTVTCTGTARLNVTGTTNTGVTPHTTPGQLTTISCDIVLGSTCATTVTGSAKGVYTDPAATPTTALGSLTIGTAAGDQVLTSTPRAGSTCTTLPGGSATFTDNAGSPSVYTVSPRTFILAT
jgi:hypothetical protein